MQTTFKIETLLPAAFMGRGLPFPGVPPNSPQNHVGEDFNELGSNVREWPELPEGLTQESALGTKFYLPVGFKIDSTVYQLPWEPSMTITTRKIIVKTALAGNTRRGSVKELINADDYIITLQGICFDHTHKNYPFEQIEILKNINDYKGSIKILSALTALFEINNVVIEELQLPAVSGRPYSQPYILTLSSDEDFLLIQD